MFHYEESDQDVINGYKAYMEAKGKPVGQSGGTPCPDCGGNGVVVKKIPILNVKCGKVCRKCGGTGCVDEGWRPV